MKPSPLSLVFFLCPLWGFSQNCYQISLDKGDKAYQQSNYKEAIRFWEAGKKCIPTDVKTLEERIWKAGDTDGDGIVNGKDRCPDQAARTKNGCPPDPPKSKPTQPAKPTDAAHWAQIESAPSREKFLEHLRLYPKCIHEPSAIRLLSNPPPPQDNMVLIQGGTLQMGSNDGGSHEKPVHAVTLSDFYMGITEVTVAEFGEFADASGYKTDAEKGDGSYVYKNGNLKKQTGINWRHDAVGNLRPANEYNHPVIHVSWNDAVAYCNWLSEQHGFRQIYQISGETVTADWTADLPAGKAGGYRLPTEAEWEYAARSRGGSDKWAGTSSEANLAAFANYWENGTKDKDGYEYTSPVGSFRPNAAGLYDMSGNVWEWCWDWFGDYSASAQNNPKGPDSGSDRVIRGGSWGGIPAHTRCADRFSYSPDFRRYNLGFRLSRAVR